MEDKNYQEEVSQTENSQTDKLVNAKKELGQGILNEVDIQIQKEKQKRAINFVRHLRQLQFKYKKELENIQGELGKVEGKLKAIANGEFDFDSEGKLVFLDWMNNVELEDGE